jgi:hypothetical protein
MATPHHGSYLERDVYDFDRFIAHALSSES